MKKILVIYYSQTGQTRRIAELLAGKLHADLAEVRTVRVYNDDMWKAYDESQQELREGKLPELKGRLPNVAAYDTVIIGGPVWGQTLSNPILALLRQMDFTGKTVSSFWTFYDHDENYERAKNYLLQLVFACRNLSHETLAPQWVLDFICCDLL